MADEGTSEGTVVEATTGAAESTASTVEESSAENYSSLAELTEADSGEDESVTEKVTAPKLQTEKVTPVVATPEPTPVPVVAPKAKPVVAPTEPAKPVEPVAEPALATEPAFDPQKYLANRAQVIQGLASAYSLSEEQTAALAVEPEKILPQLAAEIQLNTFEAILTAVTQMLPKQFESYARTRQATEAQRKAFFTEWPELNKPEYGPRITSIADAFMRANPKATPKEQRQGIGAMAMYMLGLNKAPAVPSTATPRVVPIASPKPFTPAATGHSGSAQSSGGKTIYEELAGFEFPDT